MSSHNSHNIPNNIPNIPQEPESSSMIATFVNRFWLSIVLCIFLFLSGLISLFSLDISMESQSSNTVLSVEIGVNQSTTAELLGKFCNKVEKKIKSINKIKYFQSDTDDHRAIIEIYFNEDANPYDALNNVREVIAQVRTPSYCKYPIVHMSSKKNSPVIKLNANSEQYNLGVLTEYAETILMGKLERIDGVSYVEVFGQKKSEVIVDFNPSLCAYYNITAEKIRSVLERTYGSEDNMMQRQTGINQFSVLKPSGLINVDQVANAVVDSERKLLIKDIARVYVKTPDSLRTNWVNGAKDSISISIYKTANGNPIQISNEAQKIIEQWKQDFSLNITLDDNSIPVRTVVKNVIKDILMGLLIILIIVLCFLGSAKASITPMLAIPISLVATFFPMKVFGCAINVSTMMAMIIAVGLVVDDAIVVVENILKFFKGDWREAAIEGSEDIKIPIIVMTMTLGCVFLPIVFMKGKFGAILKDFAITLSSAVFISGLVSLTLTPMVCGRIMGHSEWVEKIFQYIENAYGFLLKQTLRIPWLFAGFGVLTCGSSGFILKNIAMEGSPSMVNNRFEIGTLNVKNKNMDYLQRHGKKVVEIIQTMEGIERFALYMNNNISMDIDVKPGYNVEKVQEELLIKLSNNIVDLKFSARTKDSGLNFDVYLYGQIDRKELDKIGRNIIGAINNINGIKDVIIIANTGQAYDLKINYNKAAELGIDPEELKPLIDSLNNRYKLAKLQVDGKNYKIIGMTNKYSSSQDVMNYVWHKMKQDLEIEITPSQFTELILMKKYNNLCNFMGLPAFQLQIVCHNNGKLSTIIDHINAIKKEYVGNKLELGYTGKAREFLDDQSETSKIMIMSVVSIFLILLAQFESLRNTAVIMTTAPLAIWGALIIALLRGSMNTYSILGIVTLTGLIVKHGILFINALDSNIKDIKARAVFAAQSRLRPVLMTTLAMALGIAPLLFNNEASMIYLKEMSYVLFPGIMIGTLMTLFVVPSIYYYIGDNQTNLENPENSVDINEKIA